MTPSIVKMAIAASFAVIAGLFGVSQWSHQPDGGFRLLAKACAAEESLFTGTKIIHIQNETIVYACPSDPAAGLDYTWLPMCSVKPDGQLRINQLKLSIAPQSYVVTDHSWYDPATGRFSRVLRTADAVVFANSYDGEFIYDANGTPDGAVHVMKEAVAPGFRPPQSPAEYLGLAAGLKSALARDDTEVQSVEEGTLSNGEPAHVFQVGTPDPNGQMDSYWLFKVRDADSTIAEEEFILSGRPQLLIRRLLTESVATAAVAWDLTEIEGAGAAVPQQISITPDMVIPRVSVEHMVKRAKFETYVFSTKPAWTGAVEITDSLDVASLGARMFMLAARADDGRHLVLVQSPTYNKMFGSRVKQGGILVYTSPNGFKVWGGGPQKWYSEILLNSARASLKDRPSENRIGYILQSPAGTFPALAVNGPLTDEELHKLVDSLIPAKEYLASQPAPAPEK